MPLVDPITMPSSSSSSPISKPPKAPPSSASGKTSESLSSSAVHHPVPVHPSAASQAARHVFPVLLGALFYAAFSRLVADPVPVMWASLPVVALLQVSYAFLCLPMAGSGTAKNKKQRPGEKKKDGSGPNFIVTSLLALLLSLILTPVLHATMILFGAPLLTHTSHTFLCAAHLSILTSFPLFVVHGVDPSTWLSLASFKAPFDECYGGLLGGFLGAWLGAVPIPLDWDREWQKWPVTILVGIYAGYVLGRVLGGTLLFGKRF